MTLILLLLLFTLLPANIRRTRLVNWARIAVVVVVVVAIIAVVALFLSLATAAEVVVTIFAPVFVISVTMFISIAVVSAALVSGVITIIIALIAIVSIDAVFAGASTLSINFQLLLAGLQERLPIESLHLPNAPSVVPSCLRTNSLIPSPIFLQIRFRPPLPSRVDRVGLEWTPEKQVGTAVV